MKSVDNALKEVFLAKILSALEVGPEFTTILCYDAILYKNRLQYAMELCVTDFEKLDFSKVDVKSLMASLKVMHNLNICHFDIKLENVGWSEAYKKFVFLDFGLTQAVFEPKGYKTKTNFRGTFRYCSPEMRKLYYIKNSSLIDPYYNDLHSLQITLK